MRKKIFILAGIACLAFTGCGNGNDNQGSNTGGTANPVVATEEADALQKEAGTTVMPLPALYTDKASDEMPDGEYSVALDVGSLKETDAGYQMSMEFYDYDRYAIDDIDSLKPGDTIQVQGKDVKVTDIALNKDQDGNIVCDSINGGIEEGGVDLLLLKDCYRTTSMDDVPLYYSIGKGTLTISKDMTLKDCIDYDTLPDGVESRYDTLPDSITKQEPECWSQAYTVVTVKDGVIVKIVRNWRP